MVRGISQDKAEWLAVTYVQPLIQKKALGYGLPEEADGSRNQEEGRLLPVDEVRRLHQRLGVEGPSPERPCT